MVDKFEIRLGLFRILVCMFHKLPNKCWIVSFMFQTLMGRFPIVLTYRVNNPLVMHLILKKLQIQTQKSKRLFIQWFRQSFQPPHDHVMLRQNEQILMFGPSLLNLIFWEGHKFQRKWNWIIKSGLLQVIFQEGMTKVESSNQLAKIEQTLHRKRLRVQMFVHPSRMSLWYNRVRLTRSNSQLIIVSFITQVCKFQRKLHPNQMPPLMSP